MAVDFESKWTKCDFFSYHQRIRKDGPEKLSVVTIRTDLRKPKISRDIFSLALGENRG